MSIELPKERSKLVDRLESFKHPVTGHIELNPRVARTILLESLLAYFRVHESLNPNVEVLAQIAGDGEEMVNFTEAHRNFIEKQEAREAPIIEDELKIRDSLGVVPRLRQPEI